MKERLKEADRKWQKVICHMAGNRCQFGLSMDCTGMAYNGAHHRIPRWHWKVRYDMKNGECVCPSCHDLIESDLIAYMAWLKENRPEIHEWIENTTRDYENLGEGRMDACIRELEDYCREYSI